MVEALAAIYVGNTKLRHSHPMSIGINLFVVIH